MAAILLDTHFVLWASSEPEKLSHIARSLIENVNNNPCFSAVSIWEVAIKSKLGRTDFNIDPRRLRRHLLANKWTEIVITSEHAAATTSLPDIHKDPFDRLLIAQAQVEEIELVTSDRVVARYPGAIRKL